MNTRTCGEIKHVNFHGFTIFQRKMFLLVAKFTREP